MKGNELPGNDTSDLCVCHVCYPHNYTPDEETRYLLSQWEVGTNVIHEDHPFCFQRCQQEAEEVKKACLWGKKKKRVDIYKLFCSLLCSFRLSRFLEADDQRSIVKFARLFKTFEMMHEEHSKHEDDLVYPLFNSYFPGYTRYSSKVPFLHGYLISPLRRRQWWNWIHSFLHGVRNMKKAERRCTLYPRLCIRCSMAMQELRTRYAHTYLLSSFFFFLLLCNELKVTT